jgi:hypothetical protein
LTTLPLISDPLSSALNYATAPYARGTATLEVLLGPATAGISDFPGYTFSTFQSRFGIQTSDLNVTYIVMLTANLGDGPTTLEVGYTNDDGPGTARVVVPAGTLPGVAFPIPTPALGGVSFLQSLTERPAPAAASPSGPDKWKVTALLGNTARLLALLLGERQAIAAAAEDVSDQRSLMTSRGWSLELKGQSLGVPRQLPSAYRLDLDSSLIALYHLDDAIGPVVDATGEHPGVNQGAQRGVAGRIGNAAQITTQGGITIPDDTPFAIPPGGSFTVEMFAQLPALQPNSVDTLAVKRPHATDPNSSGWALTAQAAAPRSAILTFTLTDRAGTQISVVTPPVVVAEWFHIAGVLDGAGRTLALYLNGKQAASAAFSALIDVQNCADIGLGADRTGAPLMAGGVLDEVRFSNIARNDFSAVVAGAAYTPDTSTIALYHLDETDDLVDEASARHFGLNRGATRGVLARFGSGARFTGDPLPEAHCASEVEFQRQLNTDTWDRTQGGPRVTAGPYTRFGYKQGAISLPGLSQQPQPVLINDATTVGTGKRGLVTTACYGFVPTDLTQTITAFQQAGRSVQEAIDYFGDWNGEADSFYTTQYQAHGVTAAHENCLPTPATPTSILIAADPGLVIDQNSNLTVEAFINPDPIASDYPRAIAASRSSGLRQGEPNANEAGWALTVCGCDCIPNNLQWTLGDVAGNLVTVIANIGVADGSFHHVAGVLDRDAGVALLFIDGVEVAKQPIGTLGAVSAASDVTLGNDPLLDAPYAGIIDEVRISRAARRTFHPVLGESDDRYRQRLAIFAPYRLSSFITLQRGVRALSLPTSSTADAVALEVAQLLLSDGPPTDNGQLDVLETDSTRFCASRQFHIVPGRLTPGQRIAADGTLPADEAAATGTYTFHQEALVRHADGKGLSFPTEGSRWMILRAAQALEALAGAVLAVSNTTQLVVQDAWSSATPLHSQGRSLDVALANPGPGMDPGLLAAMAHEVGVEFVSYDVTGFVRLSFAAGNDLDVTAVAVTPPGSPVEVAVTRPALSNPALLQFRLVRCGNGNGTLSPDPNSAVSRLFTGSALGQVTIAVQYPLPGGGVLRGGCVIAIAPQTLDGCTTIDSQGNTGVTEAAGSGTPDADFQEAYLLSSNIPTVSYASPAARRMQLPLDTALRRLVAFVAAEPSAPQITVLAAYDSTATNLQAVGRGLVMAPSGNTLTAARLGALAYRAGFSYIERRRYPASVYASVSEGPRFQIVSSPIQRLWPNARISGLGELMRTEFAAAGPPDPGFTTAILQLYTNAEVAFAAGVSNLVQPTLTAALNQLMILLANEGVTGTLQIVTGFTPSAADLTSVGRAVLMRHPTVTADRLSGYCLEAGFGFVQHRPNVSGQPAVYAAAYAANAAPLNVFTDSDLVINELAELSVQPQLQITGALDWCVTPCCGAAGSLTTAYPAPGATGLFIHKILQGTQFGTITLDASFSLNDAAEPYQFIVIPRALERGSQPRLTKDQYDDLLNFLDAYCPAGVEAITRRIRGLVHGFSRPPGWTQLPTSATFPRYRLKR